MFKSFLLYTNSYETIEELTQEQKGNLLDAIFKYEMGEELPQLDQITRLVFKSIRIYLDENNKKYIAQCERARANGQKGGAPKGNRNASKTTENNPLGYKTTENNQVGKKTTENNLDIDIDNDIDTDIDNYKDKVIDKDKDIKGTKNNRFIIPTLEEVKSYIQEMHYTTDAQHFIDYYTARGWELTKGRKMKDWKAALRTWNSNAKNWNKENVTPFNAEQRKGYGAFEDELFKPNN